MGPSDEPLPDSSRGLSHGLQPLPPPHEAEKPSLLAEKRAQDTPLAFGQAPPRALAATTAPQWPAGQLAGACGAGLARTAAGGGSGGVAAGQEAHSTQPGARTEGEAGEPGSGHTGAAADGGAGPRFAGSSALQPGPLLAEGITVKNTFLDFETGEHRTSLRAVQTAAGRLDLLGQEDAGED
mmetsp:Transcript_49968/g.154421  ORF Transcript_49968/g.154421 Transcript_49968/m.154421 type:complete len:182 (-) Transcript_49968:56-601(-)